MKCYMSLSFLWALYLCVTLRLRRADDLTCVVASDRVDIANELVNESCAISGNNHTFWHMRMRKAILHFSLFIVE